MILALVIVPTLAGIGAFFVRPDGLRRGLLLLVALAHAGMTASAWVARPGPALGGWLAQAAHLRRRAVATVTVLFQNRLDVPHVINLGSIGLRSVLGLGKPGEYF